MILNNYLHSKWFMIRMWNLTNDWNQSIFEPKNLTNYWYPIIFKQTKTKTHSVIAVIRFQINFILWQLSETTVTLSFLKEKYKHKCNLNGFSSTCIIFCAGFDITILHKHTNQVQPKLRLLYSRILYIQISIPTETK